MDIFGFCRIGDVSEMRKFIENGGDVDIRDSDKNTLLVIASCYGNFDIVKILLEKGADPNVQNVDGTTPLATSSRLERDEIVKELLINGADPNVKDKFGDTPLDILTNRYGISSSTMNILIRGGAVINKKNDLKYSPTNSEKEFTQWCSDFFSQQDEK